MTACGFCTKLLLLSIVISSAACAGRKAVQAAPADPRISWEIRTGGEFGGGQFVCGSSRPAVTCTLAASTSARAISVTVYLDFHPAAQQTTYQGTWRAAFLQGWSATAHRDVSIAIKPRDAPHFISVSGIVTDRPGPYVFSVAVDAAKPGAATGARLTVDVPVSVAGTGGD